MFSSEIIYNNKDGFQQPIALLRLYGLWRGKLR
jgi:hypothetical protein